MAGIDKTYCKTWEEYQEVIKWAKENTFTCPNGIVIKPINYCYTFWEEYSFKNDIERPIMNTSWTMDYFLIKYCPIKLVQDRMREVYDEEYVESILNGTSEYDTFVRPEPGTKVRMIKESKYHNKKLFSFYNSYCNKRLTYVFIDVLYNNESLWYNEDYDIFLFPHELGIWTSSNADLKCKSIKAVIRKIRKWKLPKGAIVIVKGRYIGESWKFKIE